jgi:hypothetical protein
LSGASAVARVRLARLAAQRLTDATRLGADPAAIARAVCGVQAQSMSAARLAIRVRSQGMTSVDVDAAVAQQRSVVRTWLMRGTLHLVASEDVRWLVALLGSLIDAREERRRAQLDLDAALCARGVAAMRRALAGGPMTRHQLRERLIARGLPIAATGQAMIHLIAHAAHRAVICYGPPHGRTDTYVLMDDWVPQAAVPRGDAALAELARRYLAGYGPAGVQDLASWSGVSMGWARAGMAAIESELSEVGGSSGTLWTLRRLQSTGGPPPRRRRAEVRLLPSWDTYTLGYRSRDSMLDPQFSSRFQGGGILYPSLCVDGQLEGIWRLDARRRELAVEIQPFESVQASLAGGIDQEVAAIGRFLGRPARWGFAPLVGLTSSPT